MSGASGKLLESVVCPACGTTLPVDQGFSAWCDHCGWNVDPLSEVEPTRGSAVSRFYQLAGQRLSRQLFESLRRPSLADAGVLRPRPSLAAAVALVIAAGVLLLPLASAALGLAFLTQAPNPLMLLLAFAFLGVGWVIRPRIDRMPDGVFTRAELPHLYELLDRVADALHAPVIDAVVLSPEFNAATAAPGWRRRRLLILGLPFWRTLEGQDKVALLGHELGHQANGDPLRQWPIHTSIASLVELYRLLIPEWATGSHRRLPSVMRQAYPLASLFAVPVEVLQYVVAQLILAIAFVQLHLIWRASQRAEYLADFKGAAVGGNRGMIGCLERLALRRVFDRVMAGAGIGNDHHDCFTDLDRAITTRPVREVERARLLVHRPNSRSDETHPPTAYRLDLLAARADIPALVVLSASDEESIEAELAPFYRRMSDQIVDVARDRLYW
jgi:Zn-dependent protease with chaperone function